MGFLDKAKAAASDLAAKADTALANSGLGGPGGAPSPEKLLCDLGVVAYLETSGRAAPEGERERIVGALRDLEAANALPPLVLQTTPPPPGAVPPPPGGTTAPPPPGGTTAPPPSGAAAPPSPPPGAAPPPPPAPPPAPQPPPPPPPSWAKPDDAG